MIIAKATSRTAPPVSAARELTRAAAARVTAMANFLVRTKKPFPAFWAFWTACCFMRCWAVCRAVPAIIGGLGVWGAPGRTLGCGLAWVLNVGAGRSFGALLLLELVPPQGADRSPWLGVLRAAPRPPLSPGWRNAAEPRRRLFKERSPGGDPALFEGPGAWCVSPGWLDRGPTGLTCLLGTGRALGPGSALGAGAVFPAPGLSAPVRRSTVLRSLGALAWVG